VNRSRRAQPLTREEIVGAALRIVDSDGLAALTMRRLGADLGVEAMTLYHYIPSKEALLDLVVERMRSQMRLADPPPDDPAGLLEALFVEYRRALTAHPNLLPLAARRTEPSATSGLDYLIGQGLARDDAVELYQSLIAFTVGYSLLGSSLIDQTWAGIPEDLADQLRQWKDPTFRRTLHAILASYGLDPPSGSR
jgi:AcrR family transcriptional regulator